MPLWLVTSLFVRNKQNRNKIGLGVRKKGNLYLNLKGVSFLVFRERNVCKIITLQDKWEANDVESIMF